VRPHGQGRGREQRSAGHVGGMGFVPSADLGGTHAVFQPAHGLRNRRVEPRQPDGGVLAAFSG